MIDRDNYRQLLSLAIQAPSGDNGEPWWFAFDEHGCNIHIEPAADTSPYNAQQCASLMAHGALAENLDIAARHLGFGVSWEWFPERGNPLHVARFSLGSAKPEPQSLFEAIPRRHTNRTRYDGSIVTDEEKQTLIASVEPCPGVELLIVNDVNKKASLASVLSFNERVVFEESSLTDFLFRQIRWTERDLASGDGMGYQTLGLDAWELPGFFMLRCRLIRRLATYVGLPQIVELKARANARSAGALGMLVTRSDAPEDFLIAGRALQRAWLTAEALGLSFQPIIGLTLLQRHLRHGYLNGFPAGRRHRLAEVESRAKSLLGLGAEQIMLGGFRIGRTSRTVPRTKRRPIDSFFRDLASVS